MGLGLVACAEPVTPADRGVERAVESPSAAPVADAPAVVDLEGRPVDPLATIGRATVLLFVSTHCPISNRYAPTVQALADRFGPQGVTTWLVYPDPEDDAAAIEAHRRAFSLSLPAVRDPGHQLVARAGVRVTPEAAVFGPTEPAAAYVGRIDDRVVELGTMRAEASAQELSDAVQAVLAGRPADAAGAAAIGCTISDFR